MYTEVRIFQLENKKSYGIGFKISDKTKTLSVEEIDSLMKKIIVKLEKNFGAMLRVVSDIDSLNCLIFESFIYSSNVIYRSMIPDGVSSIILFAIV